MSIKPYLHTYISLLLARKGISQSMVASELDVTPQFLNALILGKKKSEKIQNELATRILDFSSWEELEKRAIAFQGKMELEQKILQKSKDDRRKLLKEI